MKTSITSEKINLLLRDLFVAAGAGLIVGGCALAWLPLGLIMGGLALGILGIAGQLEVEHRRKEQDIKRRLGQ